MSFREIEFPRVCHSGSAVGKRVWCIYILHDNHARACVCVCVCVCVPRGTQKLMLISALLRPCVQHTTPVAAPASLQTPTSNPTPCVTDDTRHRYEISADTDAAEHAAPVKEKCWKTEDTHNRQTCTVPKWTLRNARNLLTDTSMTGVLNSY
jgi:hypothetical protein